MDKQSAKICLGCMKHMTSDNGVCEKCGFDPQRYEENPRCLKLGTVLNNKYVVGKVLGEGGFGITYIGWNTLLEMPVAIKEYFPQNVASRDGTTARLSIYKSTAETFEDGMRRLLNEARTMSKMESYSGIVSIYDFFNENNTAYIIMEYVEGCTLKEYMQENGVMECSQVLKIMKPVMQALDKMHSLSMIHRDISPDNIMIRSDGQVKLIDFGATRIMQEEGNKSLTVMLKRGFTPEEQYRSKGKQGPWTDVYALCATIYYMISGSVLPEAMDRLVEDSYVSIGALGYNIEKNVVEAIDKGLAVRAVDRVQSMSELIDMIYNRKDSKAKKTGSEKPVKHKDSHSKKKTPVLIGIIAVVLIIGGIISAKVIGGGSSNSTPIPDDMVNVAATTETPDEEISETMAPSDEPVPDAAVVLPTEPTEATIEPEVAPSEITPEPIMPTEVPQPVLAKVPSVIKKTLTNAKKKLKNAGLKYEISKKYSDSVAKGKVISQGIEKGTMVAVDTVIKLTVSNGKKPATPSPKPINKPASSSSNNGNSAKRPSKTPKPKTPKPKEPDIEPIPENDGVSEVK